MNGRFWVLIIAPAFLLACSGKPEIIERKCSHCHDPSVVYQKKRTPEEWDRVLYGMKALGLKVSPEEEREIREVLAKRYTLK